MQLMMRRVERLVDLSTTLTKLAVGFGIAGYLVWCSFTKMYPESIVAMMLCTTAVMVAISTLMLTAKPQSA